MPSRLARRLRVHEIADAIDARLPHGLRTTSYAGFELVHRRRNSLIERIRQWGPYEQATVDGIVRELETSTDRTLLDVGANIGLVSLAVLAALPDARVYAFEPGPEQRALLAETIRRNDLGDRIELFPIALSDTTGEAEFAVHVSRHAAGDGLRDTGRSGGAHFVTVATETLDAWWVAHGRPQVDVVKLDTEGSELLVLRGGVTLLAQCRPVVFLEIHDLNLRAYPYDADDVRRHLQEAGYVLEATGRADFIARPR